MKDVPKEISDRFNQYVDSDNFKELLQNNSRGEIKNMSTHIVKDVFTKFVQSDESNERIRHYSDKILQSVSQNFTSSIELKELVQNKSKEEVDDLNKRTKQEIEELKKRTKIEIEELEDINRQTNKKIRSLEKQTENLMILALADLDCLNIKKTDPTSTDGVYTIRPQIGRDSFSVYCDMTTDGGGWTVFQQRLDGSVDFYRDWNAYKTGFRDINGEFWLGNEKLHALTSSGKYKLKIVLGDWDGTSRYAEYSYFSIGSEDSNYRLNVSGYSGDAGDGMEYNNGSEFSTKDRDHNGGNCAVDTVGAWWYKTCTHSNLNGEYIKGKHSKSDHRLGVYWYYWTGWNYSLQKSKMMIRRA